MKVNKIITGITAGFLFAGMLGTGVSAAGFQYEEIAGTTVSIEKYLIMDQEANVPNTEFTFTIAPGTAKTGTADTLRIFSGKDPYATNQADPVVGTAVFAHDQQTWTTAQNIPTDTGTKLAENTKDPVASKLTAGKKYARSSFTVNFSGVKFKEPGIYRWVITEETATVNTTYGITNDPDATRLLDIYIDAVEDTAGNPGRKLEVVGYVLHNSNDGDAVPKSYAANNPSTKTFGYVNEYETENLTIRKVIDGNQASRDEYFEFIFKVTDAVDGTVYRVILDDCDAETLQNGLNQGGHKNAPAMQLNNQKLISGTLDSDMKFTADPSAGEAASDGSMHFWLQGDQSILIQGLSKNTGYDLSENDETMDANSYLTTITSTGDTTGQTKTGRRISDSDITADSGILYTNSKSGIVPTGIIVSILPSASVLGLGIVTGLLAVRNRNH